MPYSAFVQWTAELTTSSINLSREVVADCPPLPLRVRSSRHVASMAPPATSLKNTSGSSVSPQGHLDRICSKQAPMVQSIF
jgi:hypothetical protein